MRLRCELLTSSCFLPPFPSCPLPLIRLGEIRWEELHCAERALSGHGLEGTPAGGAYRLEGSVGQRWCWDPRRRGAERRWRHCQAGWKRRRLRLRSWRELGSSDTAWHARAGWDKLASAGKAVVVWADFSVLTRHFTTWDRRVQCITLCEQHW